MKEVGSLLRQTRESQGFDIGYIAKKLKVRPEYLEILERGDVSSVSKDIYIIGYLKSYSNWLGLNSNEVTYKFKSLNNEFPVSTNASTTSGVFFTNMDDRLIMPPKVLILACVAVCVLVLLITIPTEDSKKMLLDKYVFNAVRQTDGKYPYAGFLYKADESQKLMFIAKNDVILKLRYNESSVVEKSLISGEVYFLGEGTDVLISSDKPKDIDVFSGGEGGEYQGSLQDFYISN